MVTAAVPVCWSSDLRVGARPRAVVVAGDSLALIRDVSGPRAFVDACPHRAYPLSRGRVDGGQVECGYHGWRFDRGGACVAVPGLARDAALPTARLVARGCVDAHGVTWVAPTDAAPRVPSIETLAGPGAVSLRWSQGVDGALADVAENILDVAHTAFLHRGIFRGTTRGIDIEARARRTADRLEVEYIGEPAPRGLLGRVLAPRGGVVTHVDRFVMPCVAQVEYSLGAMRLLATSFLRAEGPSRTRALHVISLAPRALAIAAMPLFAPLAWHVLRQDAHALRAQARSLAGGERTFASTEIDLVGPHVRQMLDRADRGSTPLSDAEWSVTLRL